MEETMITIESVTGKTEVQKGGFFEFDLRHREVSFSRNFLPVECWESKASKSERTARDIADMVACWWLILSSNGLRGIAQKMIAFSIADVMRQRREATKRET